MKQCSILPVSLRCEYRRNPCGLGERQPRFSWIDDPTSPVQRGISQSSWQIRVYRGPDGCVVWDSGKIKGDDCSQIEYHGEALVSGAAYRSHVRVWDEQDRESPWSEDATFRMGLLDPSEWKADWIGAPSPRLFNGCRWVWHPDEAESYQQAKAGILLFQHAFDVPDKASIVSGVALLAGSNSFTVFVNGKQVGTGQGAHAGTPPVVEIDLMGGLTTGRNVLVLRLEKTTEATPGALAGKVILLFADQTESVHPINNQWRVGRVKDGSTSVPHDIDLNFPCAHEILGVGVTDPIGGMLTPWTVPGSADNLSLPPALVLRREIDLAEVPEEAVVHAAALGIYDLWINGHKVGADWFTPGWSDYAKRVYANTYEVSSLLRKGTNVLIAQLAEGWYCGYAAWSRRRDHYGTTPRFKMRMDWRLADGSVGHVATGRTWKVSSDGPIREADLLMGEVHDARRPDPARCPEARDALDWSPVVVGGVRPGEVEPYPGEPVRAIEEIRPILVTEPRSGVQIFDLGQNITGVVRLRAVGPAGTLLRLRYAEVLTEEGELYTEALRGARSTDTYIKGTDDEEVWQPRFTFHGFRFVEVEGLPCLPNSDAVTGIVLHNSMEKTGELRTSSEMVNQLVENIRWGQRGNFLEVPTDCPQRDERLGWTGDAQIFIRTATFNYDVASFFTKWLRDLFDSQRPDGWFCMVAPIIDPWPNPDWGSAAWTDAAIICPWTMYRVYGDRRLVGRYWDQMVAMMDWLERTSDGLIRPDEGFGDWVSLNAHTPRDLVGTAYFAYDALLMEEMARAIGRDAEAEKYAKLYEAVRAAFQKAYIEPDGGLKGRTQCAYVLALRFGLLPDHLRPVAATFLAQDLAYRRGHFSTGFVGLKDLMPALTDSGRNDLACKILLNEEFPSWGYQIRAGATTVWERWDGWSEELGLQTPHMNSFNHYAFGAVGEWLYSRLVGIDVSTPMYRRVRIAPHPDSRLRFAKARYRSASGWIGAEWLLNQRDRTLTLRCRIPVGCTAEIDIPWGRVAEISESGTEIETMGLVRVLEHDRAVTRVEVPSGHYEFRMPWRG